MSMTRFAMLCDHCGLRSAEYKRWNQCLGCLDDVCDQCILEGSGDDETNSATCKICAVLEATGGAQ
jgi:hypothetical protein